MPLRTPLTWRSSETQPPSSKAPHISPPPETPVEPVVEFLHGIEITDPYRWLEDQNSAQTREWIQVESERTRKYLDALPDKQRIRSEVCQLQTSDVYDSLQKLHSRYFFRKRAHGQEQFCLYFQEGPDGREELIIDPNEHPRSPYVFSRIRSVSTDGKLLAYELTVGGAYQHTLHVFDVERRAILTDPLPEGLIRAFVFAPEGNGFYYVPDPAWPGQGPSWRLCKHTLGTRLKDDEVVFDTGDLTQVRIGLRSSHTQLGIVLVTDSADGASTDFYVKRVGQARLLHVVKAFRGTFAPFLLGDRIFALTNCGAPAGRIVEVTYTDSEQSALVELVPEERSVVSGLAVANEQLFVAYLLDQRTVFRQFDLRGTFQKEISFQPDESVTLVAQYVNTDEILYERESFTQPKSFYRYCPKTGRHLPWRKSESQFPFRTGICHQTISFRSKDGAEIPLHVVGRDDITTSSPRPTVLTAYGGFGLSMTPRFGALTSFLVEHGCWFALAAIRGGSEFGREWHNAARRKKRQNAYDDFIAGAEFLIAHGYTTARQLGIFGGSNSGLLVGVAMTQRPELFRAVLCLAPLLDMLRYHLFDFAADWKEEFGSAEDKEDFQVLRSYSPYHNVHSGVSYPATLIVSGDADENCNPMHARKMTAKLQACNKSERPVLLDYHVFRGHLPALPFSERLEALTDRLSFLCHELGVDLNL